MSEKQPDNTALRTALWRALHVLKDEKPAVFDDTIGYELIQPDKDWQERPDMKYTSRLRASMVARARFVEDRVMEEIANGLSQYVLLGAGLDSFAQRHNQLADAVNIYEIDQADTLAWKAQRLIARGYPIPENQHFVPANFETSSWWEVLLQKGFNPLETAFISCVGVTLYLTAEANAHTLKAMTAMAAGSIVAMAFYLPTTELEEEDKALMEMSIKGAAASGTPFVSFYTVDEVKKLAIESGLKEIQIVTTADLESKYFMDRKDALRPASGEFFLLAKV